MKSANKFEYFTVNRGLHDLNPRFFGWEDCNPHQSLGPAVRNCTLLHCIIRGSGTFQTGGVTYTVKKGEVFRIIPGEVTCYAPNPDDPWEYRWLAFDGALAERFATLPPVFPVSAEAMRCFEIEESDTAVEYRMAAKLFLLYAEIFGPASSNGHYVRRVCDYINACYMQDLRVETIAEQMHLDRRYLSYLFRQKKGQTIQQYLISVRMCEAQKYLMSGNSVSRTAELVGYKDAFRFSKMFKKHFGMSPAIWKKHLDDAKDS